MARPTVEYTTKLTYTQSGRRGGLIGNYTNAPVFTNYGFSGAGVVGSYRQYSGVLTPNFFSRLVNRTLPVNDYSVRYNRVLLDTQSSNAAAAFDGYTYWDVQSHTSTKYSFTPSQLGLDSGLIDARNKAALSAGKKLAAVRFNIAQFAAERKQTADLLASTANRIYQAARSMRRADLRSFSKALSLPGTESRTARQAWKSVERTAPNKRLANHWLEYVYGWLPLLSDVHDAAELLAERQFGERPPRGVIRASGRGSYSLGASGLLAKGYPEALVNYEANAKARYRLWYEQSNEIKTLLAQTGITNPALLAWELLPYSFVVDWFVPVGTYLEHLTAFDGFDLVQSKSCLNTQEEWSYVLNYNASGSTAAGPWYRSGMCKKTEFLFTRTKPPTFPSYLLQAKSPIGGEPLKRFLTAASLLRVLFN